MVPTAAPEDSAVVEDAARTTVSPLLPWAVAASFAILCLLMLALGNSLRQKNRELAEKLADAEQAFAEVHQQQTNLQAQMRQVETNYSGRISDLQKQMAQKTQEFQRERDDLKSRLETQVGEVSKGQQHITVLRNRIASDASELERLNEQVGTQLPNNSGINQVRIGLLKPTADGPPNASGAAVWDGADQKGNLVVENLSPLPSNLDYQIWIIDPNLPTLISGGTFRVSERGTSRIEFKAATQVQTPERFAVSIERRGGSAVPLGRIILASN
jgi:F0F1-type ATP synthase membrane subunit b/b'